MKIRAGFLYALLLALGLLLWTQALDSHHALKNIKEQTETIETVIEQTGVTPWTSAEAVYACAMKAKELHITLETMEVSPDSMQGSMALKGELSDLKAFYQWLETEGCLRSILSLNLENDEKDKGTLSLSFMM